MTKKIFILGAGASRPAGIPIQSNMINEIFSLNKEQLQKKNKEDLSFIDSKNDLFSQFALFNKSRKIFARFLIKNFGDMDLKEKIFKIDKNSEHENSNLEKIWSQIFDQLIEINISLENIFTIIDKAIGENSFFQNYSINDLKKVQLALDKCLIYILSYYTPSENHLYEKISEYFATEANSGNQPVIISLNWDTIIDNFLFNKTFSDDIIVDYCTDCYNIDTGKVINRKSENKIKLLKLHGSINWLICRNCFKLYAQHDQILALSTLMDKTDQNNCHFCSELERANELESSIITPTYIKNFENLHYQRIWRDAFNELAKADEVIFIGYSFPEADYELRYLLKKAIKKQTKIKVILYKTDNPEYYSDKINNQDLEFVRGRLELPEKRYSSFFNKNNLKFNYKGIKDFFQKEEAKND
jgi:NAD-dependent SIR2 family protein deacetylase